MSQLDHRETPPADVLIKGAHVLDPRTGIDERLDIRITKGTIAELGVDLQTDGEVIDGTGKHVFPGFVDPHVHLRVPGQEHKEDLETGTRSAAAGGFVAVVAMPNTSPTVDSAPILRSLREAARREARVPVGFLASVTTGLHGEALTEMAELRESGALGFTDDGKPVHRAGLLRKALQYQKLVGAIIALHEEDPTLSGKGCRARGRGLRAARPGGHPEHQRVDADRPRRRDRRLRGRPHPHPAPERARVGRGRRRGQGARGEDHLRGQPAPPHADGHRAPGAARHAAEDEPAAALASPTARR